MKDIIEYEYSLTEENSYFIKGNSVSFKKANKQTDVKTVVVDPTVKDQTILGFGSILTETDIHAILRMNEEKQEEALTALFDKKSGLGWNLMRVPLGSTDWEVLPEYYTYDDMPQGEKDPELKHFSIQKDIDRGVFRLLRRAKEINPELMFYGSVWGLPAWMKENDSIMYGRFDPAYSDVYARYLAKAISAFKEQGIELYAITPQNESLTANDRATPATRMTWWIQRDVVMAMRKEFDRLGINTKIWIYDHNFDMSDYFVKPFLEDDEARKAIDGVAYHDYGGEPFVMEELHKKYPEINFYMTERSIKNIYEMNDLVKELRAGAKCYNQWTTISDEYGGPFQFCGRPFIYHRPSHISQRNYLYNLKEDPNALFKAPSYGLYGQFTRWFKRDMVRVDSTYGEESWVTTVAFTDTKTDEITLLCINSNETEQKLNIRCGGGTAEVVQKPMSIATYRFTPGEICSGSCSVSDIPYSTVIEEDTWDIEVTDIKLNGKEEAEEDLMISAVVKNVGRLPTPDTTVLAVGFSLDGDCEIGRSAVTMPKLDPGEIFEAKVNVPVGMPYYYRIAWHAEKGRHQIFARATVGNTFPEKITHNNVFAKEFDFK